MKIILKIPIMIILMCLIGYLMLVLVYCLPTRNMEQHIQRSRYVFLKEGTYPRLTDIEISQLDNFTDALMLLTAAYPREGNVWEAAVNATRYHIEAKNPVETLIDIYEESEMQLETLNYQRYWHGYLIFLKPLLLFFDYSRIRYFIMFAQLCLFSILISSLAEQRKNFVIPTAFIWLFLNPIATMCSLQFNSIVMVTFATMILIVRLNNIWKEDIYKWGMLFLFVGGVTSYLDLLTYPIFTLGAPLILWLSFHLAYRVSQNLRHIFSISVLWVIGYGGMWAGKWLLGSIITGENIILNAFEQIAYRTSAIEGDKEITYGLIMKRVLSYSGKYIVLAAIVTLFLFCGHELLNVKKCRINNLLGYVIIASYPFLWYFILKNHSYIHSFFTYRELAVTVYAFMVCVVDCKNECSRYLDSC